MNLPSALISINLVFYLVGLVVMAVAWLNLRDMRVLKAMGETALAGVSLFSGGIRTDAYALEDQLRMNLAQNLTQEARQDLRSVKVETSVTVDSFTPVQVILLEAI